MAYTDPDWDALRQAGDPEADALVAGLAGAGAGQVDAVNRLLRQLLYNEQEAPEALPDAVEAWLGKTGRLPQGADKERLERASALFVTHGMTMALILATASLVECYAAVDGVKVLTYTYRLGQNAYRRVAETAQWLLFVMAPGGLTRPGGQGIRATQKIRLLHAAIRYLVGQTGRWNQGQWGVPVCQEDLVFTLMTFSYIVLRGLHKLGIEVAESEAEDYLYAWGVVGELLGIRPELIPRSMARARAFTEGYRARRHGPSPEGVQMTRALLEMHGQMVPGELLDGVMPALVRLLVGDRIADWMEVPYTSWHRLVQRYTRSVGAGLDEAGRKLGPVRHLAGKLGVALMTRQSFVLAGYQRAGFAIPTQLREPWGLPK